MKRYIGTLCGILITAVLTSCGSPVEQRAEQIDMSWQDETYETVDLLEVENRDNTMDLYSATVRMPVMWEEPEGAIEGVAGCNLLIQDNGVTVMKKHLFEQYTSNYDSFTVYDLLGNQQVCRLFPEGENTKQVWVAGNEWNSNHLFLCILSDESDAVEIWETDTKLQVLRTWEVDCFAIQNMELPEAILCDKEGNIHILSSDDSGTEWNYYIINPQGSVVSSFSGTGRAPHMQFLYEGSVVLCKKTEQGDNGIWQLAPGNDQLQLLYEMTVDQEVIGYTMLNQDTELFVGREGVFAQTKSYKEATCLYRWENHGIRITDVEDLLVAEDGTIHMIYADGEGYCYLLLEPTKEKREIMNINFAVSELAYNKYLPAVMEFNRSYPSYHIELVKDYEPMALRTELIAGKGPVIVDTRLTGFENLEDLWQPLDAVLASLGVRDQLIPKVMDAGRIQETMYGIVTNFSIQTALALDSVQEWNYDSFLKQIQKNNTMQAIFDGYGIDDEYGFLHNFFMSDLEDNFFIDKAACTTSFDSDAFRSALACMQKYVSGKGRVLPGKTLLNGEVLCNLFVIGKPEDVAAIEANYNGQVRYIGYPAMSGSKHYLLTDSPISIRVTASEEEKKIAYTFLKIVLSYENQVEASRDLNYNLSVRKDVLDDQIEQVKPHMNANYHWEMTTGDSVDTEAVRTKLYYLIEQASVRKNGDNEWRAIFNEEMEQFLRGSITEEMLIHNLDNRIGLYLMEGQ